MKDLILYAEKNGRENVNVEKIMRRPVYVYEYQRTAQIFKDMKASSTTMCIVLDEYGITAGLITIEDLIEEIVGDIRDEYDADEENELVHTGENEYEVPGSMSISDVNDRIGTKLESDAYDSIGGLLMEQLERLPAEGDEARIGDIVISAEKLDGTRIETVKIRRIKDQ